MGQLYLLLNVDKKQFIDPCFGAKLTEWGYVENRIADTLWGVLSDEWKGDRVIVCGDYYCSDDADESPRAEEFEKITGIYGKKDSDGFDITLSEYAFDNFTERKDLADKYGCNGTAPFIAVNTVTGKFIDRRHAYLNKARFSGPSRYPSVITSHFDPLVLLLAGGNGQGGGDYYGPNKELVGTWIRDVEHIYTLSDPSEIPEGYKEVIPYFAEELYNSITEKSELLNIPWDKEKAYVDEQKKEYIIKQAAHESVDGGYEATTKVFVDDIISFMKSKNTVYDVENINFALYSYLIEHPQFEDIMLSCRYITRFNTTRMHYDTPKILITVSIQKDIGIGKPYLLELFSIVVKKRKEKVCSGTVCDADGNETKDYNDMTLKRWISIATDRNQDSIKEEKEFREKNRDEAAKAKKELQIFSFADAASKIDELKKEISKYEHIKDLMLYCATYQISL